MSLSAPFEARIEAIRRFLDAPDTRVLVVRHDPDDRLILLRMLSGFIAAEGNPHIVACSTAPFRGYEQFYGDVLQQLAGENEAARAELATLGVALSAAPQLPRGEEQKPEAQAAALGGYVSAVAAVFPDRIGSYAVLLEPEAIVHEGGFAWAVEALAASTRGWAKYIVLDRRENPMLAEFCARSALASVLEFRVSPEEIEAQVAKDLASASTPPEERRKLLMLAGAFATSARRPTAAEGYLHQALRDARAGGATGDEANILYNLGNLYLEQRHPDAALDAYLQAVTLCLDTHTDALAALVLTNMGVCLARLRRTDEALRSFSTAYRTFAALNNLPGQAHVLDSTARVLNQAGRTEEAKNSWQQAIGLYERIRAPALRDVREAGVRDIRTRLEQLRGDAHALV